LKEDAICGAGGEYEGEEKCIQRFGEETKRKKKTYLEDLGENCSIILMRILRKKGGRAWSA
jgi:hypothetical protein